MRSNSMTKQDFIFSDVRSHQLARHITFWVVWWFAYFMFFHLPHHAIFGWNLNETNLNLQENGVWWLLKMMVFNVLLAVVVPQIIFTYTMLYFVLPRYFYQKRNVFVTVAVMVVCMLAYLIIAGCLKPFSQLPNYLTGLRNTFPWPQKLSFFAAFRDTLTSLPIIAGLALVIKLMKRWWFKEKETQLLVSEKLKAELQLLKAQIHPHFLFNTLNNIYFFTLSGSTKAPEMIKRLSDMLKYILNDCNQPLVPLEKEIKMIEDYISLEKIRYGEQMDLSVELSDNLNFENAANFKWLIAPFLLIPFVENCFKHGASKMILKPFIKISMSVEENTLHFTVTNNNPPILESNLSNDNLKVHGKVGLKNVKKRLQLIYPKTHELTIVPESENFTVYLNILLQNITIPKTQNELNPIIINGSA
ncbi:MAG TPA: histidine kinase [Flavobacteriaceae bacterium]|nr:histidine kinase [Flavobacteriaceae bacterium]